MTVSNLNKETRSLVGRNVAFSGIEIVQKLKPTIEKAGGSVVAAVTPSLDILVYNQPTTYESIKFRQAKMIGVPSILTLDEFLALYLNIPDVGLSSFAASPGHCKSPAAPQPNYYKLPGFKSRKLNKIKNGLGVKTLKHGDCLHFDIEPGIYKDSYFVFQNDTKKGLVKNSCESTGKHIVVPFVICEAFENPRAVYNDFLMRYKELTRVEIENVIQDSDSEVDQVSTRRRCVIS